MSVLDRVTQKVAQGFTSGPVPSADLSFQFVDADTVKTPDGVLHRLQGFDAPEITKLVGGELKLGTAGGQAALAAIQDFAIRNGFTNLKELDSSAAYGRKLSTLVNDKGESLSNLLLKTGVFNLTPQSTQEQVAERAAYKAFGNIANEYDGDLKLAAETIQDAMVRGGHNDFNFKQAAFSEQERMAQPESERASTVAVRHRDRTIDNESLNPWSDSWDIGVESAIESAFGTAELLGHTFKSDTLKDMGEAGIYRARQRMSDKASLVLGFDDVNSAGDAIDLVANNIAISLPYMATTILGVSAAGVTGGLSLTAPVSLYTGQVWNEQDEKNAGTAVAAGIAMSVLDTLGVKMLGGLAKGTPNQILSKAKDAYKDKLIKQARATGEEFSEEAIEKYAEAEVAKLTKIELARLSSDVVGEMTKQLGAKQVAKNIARSVGAGYIEEGGTEAAQELIGYLGAHVHDDTVDFSKMSERMLGAASIGGLIGGTFGAAGGAFSTAAIADAAFLRGEHDRNKMSNAAKYYEQEEKSKGYVGSTVELSDIERSDLDSGDRAVEDLEDMSDRETARYNQKSFADKAKDFVMSAPALWRNYTRYILNEDLRAKSRAARILYDMFGGSGYDKVYSGPSFEKFKHDLASKYQFMIDDPKDIYAALNNGKVPNAKRRSELSKMLYAALNAATGKDGRFNPDGVPSTVEIDGVEVAVPQSIVMVLGKQLQDASNAMFRDQSKYNTELGYIGNYFASYKALNKQAVKDNKAEFIEALIKEVGLPRDIAIKVTDSIIDSTDLSTTFDLNDFLVEGKDGSFSVTRGGPVPSSHKSRTLGLAVREGFDKFHEQDLFANFETATKSAARYQAYQQFVGKNGEVISSILKRDVDSGALTQEEADKIAYGMRNYLNAESGNYKRPTTEFGKALARIQSNIIFISTFAGLPLSALSSLVEISMTSLGLRKDQILGERGSLQAMGKELAKLIDDGLKETKAAITHIQETHQPNRTQLTMRRLGYYEMSAGAASKTGVSEVSALKQHWVRAFFKWNGLQGVTDYTRAIRVSIAADYMIDHAATIINADPTKPKTNEVYEAEMHLRNLGIDPKRFASLVSATDAINTRDIDLTTTDSGPLTSSDLELELSNMVKLGTFNFVNDAIMMPMAENRPLIYQDPRFALFNQFQGFIATFQSTFIPKLWNQYIKNGSPGMKYNAFATMMTMLMMGFASQELRDRIKFGEHNPYLETSDTIRRAVGATGLLGTSERVLNALYPMYQTQDQGLIGWAWSESPSLSMVGTAASGIESLIEGDPERFVNEGLKITPVGAVTQLRKSIAKAASGEWDHKGD